MAVEESMPVALVKERLRERAARVDAWLDGCLAEQGIPDALREAMDYSLLAGGKRLRPALCLTAAALCGLTDEASIMPFAAAIEMIHTYSLIHDDLPAMDDDDLRRGKPSNHKAFGEAMAILAGDALLADAFAFMCSAPLPPERVVRAVGALARAAGGRGMAGGQALDMLRTGRDHVALEDLRRMHALKTGALIKASCVCGGLLAGAGGAMPAALETYGAALGTAFQIADDILDCTADTATLGKPAGSDAAQGKCTYPAVLGLERSRRLAAEQCGVAVDGLKGIVGTEAAFLRGLAEYVASRTC